ncbi:MAG: nucleotidyltransferase [Firmicutes bacterium HGW-Firmicutes-7]|nr:MAG: nucleotidyltransferase [Firmicutes bacterium HGW-Firmicutes-7]
MLTIEQISDAVTPLAKARGINKVYLFGSYARGSATDKSDIDLEVDTVGNPIGLFALSGLRLDIQNQLHKNIDLVTSGGLKNDFKKEIKKERVLIYEKQ